MYRLLAALLATTIVVPASAQVATIVPAATPVATIAPAASTGVLRAGTEVILRTSEALTTDGKKLREGQRVMLSVAEPVMLNGMTVIPAGSPATGEITDVRNKGMWGKSGRIGGHVLYVRVGERQIRLTGSFDDKGTTGTAGVVAAVVFIPVAGFFMTGTSAKIPLGSTVKGFLDEDLTVAMAQAAPVPMVVTAAAPILAPPPPAESSLKK